MPDKAAVRTAALATRDALSDADRDVKSREIAERVLALPQWKKASSVALYWAIRSEVGTKELFRAARDAGKSSCFPRVEPNGGKLIFHRVDNESELTAGTWGIPEPAATALVVNVHEVDLFIVPGVAFDRDRNRLGYGGGYYDKALRDAHADAAKIGLAFEDQIVPELPVEPRDIAMDTVVTEARQI